MSGPSVARLKQQLTLAEDRYAKAEAEVERLHEELSDHEKSFDLRHAADMRAIVRWRSAGTGRELTLPDHADLCVWLLDELARLREELARMAGRP